VSPETASCTMKPAAAIIARRPFWSSLVCMILNSSGSSGLRPSGSKPMSPGTYEGFSFWKTWFGRVGSDQPTCTRYDSQTPMPRVIKNQMAGGRLGICWMAGPPSPEKSGWNFSCTMKPAAASMPTRACASSASRHVRTSSNDLPSRRLKGSNFSKGATAPGRP